MEQRSACPAPPLWRGPQGKGNWGHRDAGQIAHPGGPEYALHSADGAQPGGNTPIPGVHLLACNPASVCALSSPARAGVGGLKVGRGTGGPVCLVLSAVCGPTLSSANQRITLVKGSLRLFLKALWVGVDVCFGAEGSFRCGKKRLQCKRGLQEGCGLAREGEGDSVTGVRIWWPWRWQGAVYSFIYS